MMIEYHIEWFKAIFVVGCASFLEDVTISEAFSISPTPAKKIASTTQVQVSLASTQASAAVTAAPVSTASGDGGACGQGPGA